MRSPLFHFFVVFPLTVFAITVTVIDRALSFIGSLFEPLTLRFDDDPLLALELGGGDQIDAATWHRNRHEAGLAHLGAVRHT